MKKSIIYDKITELRYCAEELSFEITAAVNNPDLSDYPKVQKLCERINIVFNQI
jgi:hypothetical protein